MPVFLVAKSNTDRMALVRVHSLTKTKKLSDLMIITRIINPGCDPDSPQFVIVCILSEKLPSLIIKFNHMICSCNKDYLYLHRHTHMDT